MKNGNLYNTKDTNQGNGKRRMESYKANDQYQAFYSSCTTEQR